MSIQKDIDCHDKICDYSLMKKSKCIQIRVNPTEFYYLKKMKNMSEFIREAIMEKLLKPKAKK